MGGQQLVGDRSGRPAGQQVGHRLRRPQRTPGAVVNAAADHAAVAVVLAQNGPRRRHRHQLSGRRAVEQRKRARRLAPLQIDDRRRGVRIHAHLHADRKEHRRHRPEPIQPRERLGQQRRGRLLGGKRKRRRDHEVPVAPHQHVRRPRHRPQVASHHHRLRHRRPVTPRQHGEKADRCGALQHARSVAPSGVARQATTRSTAAGAIHFLAGGHLVGRLELWTADQNFAAVAAELRVAFKTGRS